mmetsp:Transcript_37291/g.94031  ORF Transcript_37291/g.94031 Transcript_37291/m.94031 type:complete len:261 (-) Transcript_37291:495-1277(-)
MGEQRCRRVPLVVAVPVATVRVAVPMRMPVPPVLHGGRHQHVVRVRHHCWDGVRLELQQRPDHGCLTLVLTLILLLLLLPVTPNTVYVTRCGELMLKRLAAIPAVASQRRAGPGLAACRPAVQAGAGAAALSGGGPPLAVAAGPVLAGAVRACPDGGRRLLDEQQHVQPGEGHHGDAHVDGSQVGDVAAQHRAQQHADGERGADVADGRGPERGLQQVRHRHHGHGEGGHHAAQRGRHKVPLNGHPAPQVHHQHQHGCKG